MGYMTKEYKKEILKGYEKQFHTDIQPNQTLTTYINKDVFSIVSTDDMICVHDVSENKTHAYVFDSNDNSDIIFTHYRLQAFNTREFLLIGTIYRYDNENDHSIINTNAIALKLLNKDCANRIVFFAENYLKQSPIYTIIDLKANTNHEEFCYLDTGDVVVDEKNPYYAINVQEGNIKRSIFKRMIDSQIKTRTK